MNDFSATPDRKMVASEHVSPERAEKTARDANPPSFLPHSESDKLRAELRKIAVTNVTANPGVLHHFQCKCCGMRWSGRRYATEMHSPDCILATNAPKHDPSIDQWLSNIPSEIFEAARKVHTFFAQQGKAKWEFADIADRALVAELKLELEKLDEHLSAVRTGLLDERDEIREKLKKTTLERDDWRQAGMAIAVHLTLAGVTKPGIVDAVLQMIAERDEARSEAAVNLAKATGLVRVLGDTTEQLLAAQAERDKATDNFKLYRGMFTRIKDQIIAGYGPAEMFRWQEALKENDKGEGKVDAVAALISYFYKLCHAKSKAEQERDEAETRKGAMDIAYCESEKDLREARAQNAALRTALEIQLNIAENADETGYVTDVGFIVLETEREKARILLAETKPKEEA